MKAINLNQGLGVIIKKHREEGDLHSITSFAKKGDKGEIVGYNVDTGGVSVRFSTGKEAGHIWCAHRTELKIDLTAEEAQE